MASSHARLFSAVVRSPLFWSLAALGLLLIGIESFRPRFFLHDDNASYFIGAYLHDFRVFTETGRLAEVNYYQHSGEPFLQQGQTGVLYPPVYLGVALAKVISGDVIWSIEWIAAFHLTLGLLGFYFWMRQGGVVPGLAALGALAWVLNPFVLIVGSSWITTTYAAAWLPWMFWAFDRLLAAPTFRTAFYLGASAGLLFLQGYVQWFAYAVLFLAVYALFPFVLQPRARRPAVFFYLFLSTLIFWIFAAPLFLPMLHALQNSATRADPLPVGAALLYSVLPGDILPTELCFFRYQAFGASTVILYCAALLLLPVMALRLFDARAETRWRLLPLVFLALLALVFSTDGHALLTQLPFFDRFRWPFKVFLFADFFLVAAAVWTAASWTEGRRFLPQIARLTARICLAVIALANLSISLAFHDDNLFSGIVLPTSTSPLPAGMNPRLGRAMTFADDVPESQTYRCLTLAYATTFAFPSLGGYNPLIDEKQLEHALFQDYPNFCTGPMNLDYQKQFEARSTRYWIVEAHSSQLATIEHLPGLRQIDRNADRVIFEDTQAAPLASSAGDPAMPCAVNYSGNSLLISVGAIKSPVAVSVGPTDGWWYRLDHGPWRHALYQDDRLTIETVPTARFLEVTYFDDRFHEGLWVSTALLTVLVIMLISRPGSTGERNELRGK